MDTLLYCLTDGIGIVLLTYLIFNIKIHKRHQPQIDTKTFEWIIYCTIFQCANEIFTSFLDGATFAGARFLGLVFNSILFALTPLIIYLWTIYVDYKMFESTDRLKKIYVFGAIPALSCVILSLINLFTPIFFSLDSNNVYSRAGFNIYPYIIAIFYMVWSLVLSSSGKRRVKKYMFMPVILFLIPLIIGLLIQNLEGIPLIWVSASISILSVYLSLQNEVTFIDSLTGVYTRQYLWRHSWGTWGYKLVGGIMVDANHFKSINDNFGHVEGDAALVEIGRILIDISPKITVIRYGGDEFILLCPINDEHDLEVIEENITSRFNLLNLEKRHPYEITVALGHSVFDPDKDNLDDFVKRMDKEMYNNKKLFEGDERR